MILRSTFLSIGCNPGRGQDKSRVFMAEHKTSSAISGIVLFDMIRQTGMAAAAIEKKTGITESQMKDPDARIPMGRFLKLWQMAVEQTNDPALGLHLQEHFGTSLMHFVITIAINSGTLLEAIQSWARYDRLICEIDHIQIFEKEDHFIFTYTNTAPEYENHFIPEQYFSLALEYGRRISGQDIIPMEVWFKHRAPSYVEEYDVVFQCPVFFGKNENMIRFKKSDMALPVVSPDSYLKALLVKHADEAIKKFGDQPSLASRVEQFVLSRLHTGDVTIQSASAALHMDRSTLYRHLAKEGTSFRTILINTRKKTAREHLINGFTASQTAYLLGFTEPSAFHRAFKRWYGQSPGEFKKAMAGSKA